MQALTRGLADVADVEPWTAVFNPGVSTLDRLVELTGQVDFAAFVFAQDDWTSNPSDPAAAGQASPRDNVVFEAGLFGGALGMRRTFILHAKGAKLPTDLLGMTAVRYPGGVDGGRHAGREPEAPEGDRGRGSTDQARGRLVAALADPAHRARAVGDQPPPHLAGSGGRPRGRRPGMAGGRHALGALLERGLEGAPRPDQGLLLLERRATTPSERAAARGNGRDPTGGCRIVPRGTGRPDPRPTLSCTNEPPVSTCARIRTTWERSMAEIRSRAPGSSPYGSRSGRRSRTRKCRDAVAFPG